VTKGLLTSESNSYNIGSQSPSIQRNEKKTRVLKRIKKRKIRVYRKELDKFGLLTPYAGFAPLTPRASHLNLKNSKWLKKFN